MIFKGKFQFIKKNKLKYSILAFNFEIWQIIIIIIIILFYFIIIIIIIILLLLLLFEYMLANHISEDNL